MIRSILFPVLFVVTASLLLSGCLIETAPTGPMRANNTWLTGVWEFESKDGTRKKAIVTPVEEDRMLIIYTETTKAGKIKRQGQFPAWISRVGQASLLVIEVTGEEGQGYLLLGYQLLDPLTIRLRQVTPDMIVAKPGAYALRGAIRNAFREGMLFQGEEEIWGRTAEIYWQDGNPSEHTFKPVRNLAPLVVPRP